MNVESVAQRLFGRARKGEKAPVVHSRCTPISSSEHLLATLRLLKFVVLLYVIVGRIIVSFESFSSNIIGTKQMWSSRGLVGQNPRL